MGIDWTIPQQYYTSGTTANSCASATFRCGF